MTELSSTSPEIGEETKHRFGSLRRGNIYVSSLQVGAFGSCQLAVCMMLAQGASSRRSESAPAVSSAPPRREVGTVCGTMGQWPRPRHTGARKGAGGAAPFNNYALETRYIVGTEHNHTSRLLQIPSRTISI
jgi:hypothetical protein